VYIALFLITLSTLMLEILLTRIFSVILWYHFAFMAVSVAMFGMTAGALLVFLRPKLFPSGQELQLMAKTSLYFSITTLISFIFIWLLPFITQHTMIMVTTSYLAASIPFTMSGITVCLALTRFPEKLSKLYAVDLIGAATGCILLIYLLNLTDAAASILAICWLAMTAAWLFANDVSGKLKKLSFGLSIFILGIFLLQALFSYQQKSIFRFSWSKGRFQPQPLYEKWNSFSRIQVLPDPNVKKPFGWGFSPIQIESPVEELFMDIDGSAGTALTKFEGDVSKLNYLQYDITNLAHHLRNDADVFVIGIGGGRDILSAMAFQQKSVEGVEINENILHVVNKRFADFTGHLNRNPRVRMVNDEARSYLARHNKNFDIIQVSLIDTWAATAAGAFILAENSLYTIEGWDIFLRRLSNDGLLSFSRWYSPERPLEVYKLVSLARAALIEEKVKSSQDHILVATNFNDRQKRREGIATILVSKNPFSENDVKKLHEICDRLKFSVLYSPLKSSDRMFNRILAGRNLGNLAQELIPPKDDRPFFFSSFQLKTLGRWSFWTRGLQAVTPTSTFILAALLVLVVVLTLVFIFVPLLLNPQKLESGSAPYLVYFFAIGMGFMLVEISQMQKLIIFLGHPTYSLSVVLFSLLISGGIGSYLTNKFEIERLQSWGLKTLVVLLAVLVLFFMITRYGVIAFQSSSNSVRIFFSWASLSIAGLLMGMAFPLGMKAASNRFARLTPWLWGVNGATSVCASVLAIVISITHGISTTFWVGFFCYGLALVAFLNLNPGEAKR
jgi:spermidine synthase